MISNVQHIFPSFSIQSGIISDHKFDISPTRFLSVVHVDKNEDTSFSFDLAHFEFSDLFSSMQQHVIVNGVKVLQPVKLSYDLDEAVFQNAKDRLNTLDSSLYEIWPVDHNVHTGHHIADPWGETTSLLSYLENNLSVVRPPVNHNKLSSKKIDKYACNEMHFDSFDGMYRDENDERTKIFRYFLNLDNKPRESLICINDPGFLKGTIEPEYEPGYLDALMKEVCDPIPTLRINMPARDTENHIIHGYKILTTHLLHGEYGHKNDFLAIVNSLT